MKLAVAARSLKLGALPIGLAHRVKLRNAVKKGTALRWADVAVDEASEAVRARRAMEDAFRRDAATRRPAAE